MQIPPDVASRFASDLISLPVLAALGILASTIIGALATAVVKIIGALHEVAVTVGKVEVAVNSEKTAAIGREEALRNENRLLREFVAKEEKKADLLAQAVVSRRREDVTMHQSPAPIPVEIVQTAGQPVPVEVVTTDPKP